MRDNGTICITLTNRDGMNELIPLDSILNNDVYTAICELVIEEINKEHGSDSEKVEDFFDE